MQQQQKPSKRIVSKGEYALIRRQEAVKFGLAFCFGGIAFACLFVAAIIGIKFGVDTAVGLHSKAEGGTAASCMAVGVVCSMVSAACFHALQGRLIEAGHIEVKSLFTRANTADLPANDSLVRASQHPSQEQETTLLRAAARGSATPAEQLVRPAKMQD